MANSETVSTGTHSTTASSDSEIAASGPHNSQPEQRPQLVVKGEPKQKRGLAAFRALVRAFEKVRYSMILSKKAAPSELSLALAAFDWPKALQLVQTNPSLASKPCTRLGFFEGRKDSTVLPLHEACCGEAPVELVRALLQAFPAGINRKESCYHRYPLHCACRRHADTAVLRLLLETDPNAALAPDLLGRVPLHYALSNGADYEAVHLLIQYNPTACQAVDQRGWTPLHVACSVGCPPNVVRLVLERYPSAAIMRTKKGSSPLRCLAKDAPHREEIKQLLLQAKAEFDANFKSPMASATSGRAPRQSQQVAPEDMILV